jgi:hypothetical protein
MSGWYPSAVDYRESPVSTDMINEAVFASAVGGVPPEGCRRPRTRAFSKLVGQAPNTSTDACVRAYCARLCHNLNGFSKMPSTFSEAISQLKKAVATGASAAEVTALARKVRVPPNVATADLAALFVLVPGVLDADIGFAKTLLLGEMERTLYLAEIRFPWNASQAAAYLVPYFEYLDQQCAGNSDAIYPIHTEWNIFLNGYDAVKEVLEAYLRKVEATRKRPTGYIGGIRQALELRAQFKRIENVDFEAIDRWREYFSLLDDETVFVRPWAAKNLGALYRINARIAAEKLPSFLEMLLTMGERETQAAGVLGPFIDGFDDSCEGIWALHYHEEINSWGQAPNTQNMPGGVCTLCPLGLPSLAG